MEPEIPQPDYDEQMLLQQVARGDEKAFRTLFDHYRNRLFFYSLQITSSRELAEDIVQDTFLKIWIHRDRLTQIDHFNAYIYRVAHNGLLSGLRRKALEASILDHHPPAPLAEPDLEQTLHFKQVKQVLQEAIESLPAQQKTAYRLRREEGQRIRDIARIMNLSEITVKRHLGGAHKKLRQALEAAFPYESGILLIIFELLSW